MTRKLILNGRGKQLVLPLDDEIRDGLQAWAQEEDRTPTRQAIKIIREAIRKRAAEGENQNG